MSNNDFSLTIRLSSETQKQLDAEIERLQRDPAWGLLRISRGAVVRWAVEMWLRSPPYSPLELFRDDPLDDLLVQPMSDPCERCGYAVTHRGGRTEAVVLGVRHICHTGCMLEGVEGPKGNPPDRRCLNCGGPTKPFPICAAGCYNPYAKGTEP
jgi:hypothetical protein